MPWGYAKWTLDLHSRTTAAIRSVLNPSSMIKNQVRRVATHVEATPSKVDDKTPFKSTSFHCATCDYESKMPIFICNACNSMDPHGGTHNADFFANSTTSLGRENLTAKEALGRQQANPRAQASKKCPHNKSLPCSICDPVAANAQMKMETSKVKPEHRCDYFDLFSCPHKFNMDDAQLKALTTRYRDYQRVLHPDVYYAKADTTDAEMKGVEQQSAAIAAAYRTLRNPYQRAIYLLSLHGIDIERLSETQYKNMAGGSSVSKPNLDDLRAQEQAMLLHVMEVRETLEESDDRTEINDILSSSSSQINECLHAMEIAFERRDLFEARHRTVLLNYLSKIQQEAENKLEALQR